MYHSWFRYVGFDDMVVQSWDSLSFSDRNGMVRFKKKLQELKKIMRGWINDKNYQLGRIKSSISDEMRDIDKLLDAGRVSDSMLLRRNDLKCQLHDIKSYGGYWTNAKLTSHNQRSVVIWCEGVTREEISVRAVWDCGENKISGVPDDFTFEFFRKYWNCIGPDFCVAVEHFFVNGSFSKGCNSSFVALIPKVTDAKFVNDYRPISLIGSVYKVVTKIMATRLAMVIESIVSDTQSAFVAKRQILDGPFILNEVFHSVRGVWDVGVRPIFVLADILDYSVGDIKIVGNDVVSVDGKHINVVPSFEPLNLSWAELTLTLLLMYSSFSINLSGVYEEC
ncbi:hypothetical protein Tco_0270591 [Tanacetum coccineum]